MDTNEEKQNEVMTPEEALIHMKETTVPREEAEKWQKKYNELFTKVATGTFEEPEKAASEEEKKKAYEDAIDSFHDARGVVAQMERLIKIDDYRREHNERSIFLPTMGEPDDATVASADRVRDFIRDTLENANGDDNVFAAMVGSGLRDVAK